MKYSMSIADAGRVLGKTERTIRNYIKTGQLTSTGSGRSRLLDPEEVHELLAAPKGERITVAEIRTLRATVRRLESEVAVIQHMLDLRNESLGMTSQYAKELHAAMIEQYGRPAGSYSTAEMRAWADIFTRMDEADLLTFSGAGAAWKILLRLCGRMLSEVTARPDYSTSLELQQIHRLLADGRRRLKISIFIYLESLSDASTALERTLKEDVFERLKNDIKPS